MRDSIYLVNLWGLGDLVPTLVALDLIEEKEIKLVCTQERSLVEELIASIKVEEVVIITFNNRYFLSLYLFFFTLLGNQIIFTAPLSGKSRIIASFLKNISSKVILAKEKGNLYKINRSLLKNSFQK